jgi:hypothetical protein
MVACAFSFRAGDCVPLGDPCAGRSRGSEAGLPMRAPTPGQVSRLLGDVRQELGVPADAN